MRLTVPGALLIVVALAGCAGDPPPAAPVATPQSPSPSPTGAATTPPEFGPHSVAVRRVRVAPDGTASMQVVGPPRTTYRLRVDGRVHTCGQSAGPVASAPPDGLPAGSVHQVTLTCGGAGAGARRAVLLATSQADTFTYDFEVPVNGA